ncbi:Brp/Blh family beta-carotene 15,15'-dioxygenase [Kineococcus rubinsiae]|uniref:Brp/Blh family beta-carotene 15,15'-dioxygenase n=1 Tax=Kineococcus rubinsiae TaxID=2609562 RepID=UPI001431005C|nr:Brp/Blh family beta-carotene 15,15'-dioxygenase [Kineococcus rubinsiae]
MALLLRPTPVGRPHGARPGRGAALVSTASTGALAVLLLWHLASPASLAAAAPALAVAGLLLGLPHGAVDHLVPFWSTGEPVTLRRLVGVLTSYLAVAGLAAAALLLAPGPAFVVFLVVSALHFGRGEVVVAAARAGRPAPRLLEDLPLALAHGATVVGLLFALGSREAAAVLRQLAPAVADPSPALRLGVVAATGVLVLLAAADLARRGRWRELTELAVLVACFAVVPPAAAFGVYFGLWHAMRHTWRMVELAAAPGPSGTGPVRGPGRALLRYALHAAAPTAVALAALLAIAATRESSLLATEIAVLLALTFPHVQTVAVLDAARARGARGPAVAEVPVHGRG